MFKIINRIAECDDGKHRERNLARLDRIIIHRIGSSVGRNAVEIARSFQNTEPFAAGAYTGGEMPYTFVIPEEGGIEQALALGDYGPHARKWNEQGIGVALIGDFRKKKPKTEQYKDAIQLCKFFGYWLRPLNGNTQWIYGHSELKGASKTPNKKCPGDMLNMKQFRIDVDEALDNYAETMLLNCGVVF